MEAGLELLKKYKKIRKIAYPDHKKEYGSKMLYSIFCRSVSTFLAILLIKLNVKPNSVSMVSILSGSVGIYLLFSGLYVPGAILCATSKLLDCVDGEIARITENFSRIGSWLEPLNSNIQYLFVVPSLAFSLYRNMLIGVNTVFLGIIAAGLYVAVRSTYNVRVPQEKDISSMKKAIYCQFKHSNEFRKGHRLGALFYYLRYNLIAQNGIMYPSLILLAYLWPEGLKFYVYYFVAAYFAFFVITFAGVWFGASLVEDDLK